MTAVPCKPPDMSRWVDRPPWVASTTWWRVTYVSSEVASLCVALGRRDSTTQARDEVEAASILDRQVRIAYNRLGRRAPAPPPHRLDLCYRTWTQRPPARLTSSSAGTTNYGWRRR